MATSNNRDVRLGVEIETAGEDGVKRLAAAVRALGKEGDPAALEFNRLADELDRLSQQAGAIQSLQALRTDVETLTVAERNAATAAQAASTEFKEQTAATSALREAQALAASEVAQAKTAYAELRAELDRQIVAGKAAGESQKQLALSTEEARLNVINQRLALEQRSQALGVANSALKEAEAAEKRLSVAFERTGAAAKGTAAALTQQAVALTAAESAAVALGTDVTDLTAAQARLVESTREAAAEADRLDVQTRESAAAMQALERSAREADAQMAALATSLRETEQAARQYATATEQAAAAGAEDAAAAQSRVRAAETLIASERQLTIGQSELAAQRDRSRAALIAEAQALLTQQRAMDASRASTEQMVRESIALGTALDGTGKSIGRIGTLTAEAFGQTGVRSLQAIEAEVAKVESAMSLLERRFRAGQISADDLARALGSATVRLNTLKVEAETMPSLSTGFDKINSSITGLISKFGALGAAVATVGVVVKPVLDATVALERMRRVLTTVTGSAESAQQQIEFLRKVSQQSGQQFDVLGKSYASFAASALQSGLTIQQTQEVFKNVALAAGNLGLSTDQVTRALEALGQMASKGVITMEELRQQLGDALPGVLPLLAKQLGLTQAELFKLVSSGQLLATEGIPAIGRSLVALQAQSGTVDGMVAGWNRFINVIKEAGTVVTEGPLGTVVGVVLTSIAGVIRDIAVVAVGATEAFKLFGLSTLSVLDALAGNISLKQLKQQLIEFTDQAAARMVKFEETAYGAGKAIDGLSAATAKLGPSFARLAIDGQKAVDAADRQSQASDKHTQAVAAEGKATVVLAGLLGDEVAARNAAAEAARANALATEKQAKADEAVVAALVRAKAAVLEKARAEGLGLDVTKAVIEAYNEKIAKATADVEKTTAQADAAREHAAAMVLAAGAAKDNSKNIEALKADVAILTLAYNDATLALVADANATNDVKKAADALAIAKGLLRDAINDVSAALERQLAAMRADAALSQAQIKLDIEKAKNRQIEAERRHDENAARSESIRILTLEQALVVTGIELKRQEALATLAAVETERSELAQLKQLTPEKEAELETKRKTAQATLLEADASKEANKHKADEVTILKESGGARGQYTAAVEGSTAAVTKDTTATQANTAAKRSNATATAALSPALQQAAADAKVLGVTLEKLGPSASAGAQAALQAYERLKLGGVATAHELSEAFASAANKAIAAAGGIVPEWVKVEAATRGATIAVDAYGKATVTTAAAATESLNQLANVFGDVATKAHNAAFEASKLAEAAKASAERQALGDSATETFNSPAATLARKKADGTLSAKDADSAKTNFDAARNNLFQAQRNGNDVNVSDFNRAYNEAREIYEATHQLTLVADPQAAIAAEIARLNALRKSGGGSPSGSSPFGPKTPGKAPVSTPANPIPGTGVQVFPPAPAPPPAPNASPGSVTDGKVYTLNFNIGGKTIPVTAKSQADAEELLRQLESAFKAQGGA